MTTLAPKSLKNIKRVSLVWSYPKIDFGYVCFGFMKIDFFFFFCKYILQNSFLCLFFFFKIKNYF